VVALAHVEQVFQLLPGGGGAADLHAEGRLMDDRLVGDGRSSR
jgi:hypothetical protein